MSMLLNRFFDFMENEKGRIKSEPYDPIEEELYTDLCRLEKIYGKKEEIESLQCKIYALQEEIYDLLPDKPKYGFDC